MNTATNSEQTNEITTAPTVVRIVLQISGQAWIRNCGACSRSPEVKIAWICVSTLPPGPNQCSPLWANDGHASLRTKASIASSTSDDARRPARRAQARRADPESVRRLLGSRRTSSSMAPRGRPAAAYFLLNAATAPALVDDLAGRLARPHPVEELLHRHARRGRSGSRPSRSGTAGRTCCGSCAAVQATPLTAIGFTPGPARVRQPDVADRVRVAARRRSARGRRRCPAGRSRTASRHRAPPAGRTCTARRPSYGRSGRSCVVRFEPADLAPAGVDAEEDVLQRASARCC